MLSSIEQYFHAPYRPIEWTSSAASSTRLAIASEVDCDVDVGGVQQDVVGGDQGLVGHDAARLKIGQDPRLQRAAFVHGELRVPGQADFDIQAHSVRAEDVVVETLLAHRAHVEGPIARY
jgi:hypothetical protein